jgi:hypothetical protein
VARNGLGNLMFIDGSFFLDPWSEEVRPHIVGKDPNLPMSGLS